MIVLAVIAQKGGVGKSMLARSLAVQGLIDGRKAAILDADPQGTVVSWGRRRHLAAPAVIALANSTIEAVIRDLAGRGADLVLIDTPPHSQPIINLAAAAADAALLVTGPYPEDLEQVGVAAAILQSLGKPTGIILNKTPPKAAALTLARAALTAFKMPICPVALTQLVSHPYASAEGLSAQEREPDSKAAAEVAGVWGWVKNSILVSLDTKKLKFAS
jgi:chromosome partitioning protein